MNHPAWKLTPFYYCLDTDTSTGRWEKCVEEFLKVGINYVERILNSESDNRYLSFNHAHYNTIKKGYETGEPFCIFENDVVFDKNWKVLEEALPQLPENWDLFYLGANIIGMDTTVWQMPMPVSTNIARLFNCWMTHAIFYSNKMARWVLDNFKPDEFPVYDEWLRMNAMPEREVYIINPMICYQRPGYSVVSRQLTDYSGAHRQGNDWMKKNI
jgi:GR25 family glycosyltransferase involved in LPS biosynthesis